MLPVKGVALDSRLAGEEWMTGPYVMLAYLRALAQTLEEGRDPLESARIRTRANGQVVVEVLPWDLYDRLLMNRYQVEVWMQPGVSISDVRGRCGRCLREHLPARVALVLGAGNISSIAPLDVLYKLYADGDVVVLKMNPVNAVLQPVLERIFAPLVRQARQPHRQPHHPTPNAIRSVTRDPAPPRHLRLRATRLTRRDALARNLSTVRHRITSLSAPTRRVL